MNAYGRFFATFVSVLCATSAVRADDGINGRGSQDREAAVAERLNNLDNVVHWHGKYRVIRDTYFAGPAGITALAQHWFKSASQWISRANELLAIIGATQDQLDDPEVQTAVREKLREHQDGLLQLRYLARAVRERGDQATAQLANLAPLPNGIVAGQEQGTAFMNSRYSELGQAIAKAIEQFDGSQQAAWERTLAPLAQAAVAAVGRTMLSAPELERTLVYVEQAIAADAEFRPLVACVEQTHREFRDHLVNHRIFAAKRALEALRQEARDALSRVTESDIDPMFRQESINTLERVYAGAQSSWDRQTAFFPNYLMVARNLQKSEPRLVADCRDSEKRKGRNCALLRQLVGLKAEYLRHLPDAQLEWIEEGIERVKKGPLS